MDLGIILLAIIQGIAEFLPISSSAHLIIFRDLFGLGTNIVTGDIALIFDIALHFGTLLAIIVYFFKDFWKMFTKGITKGLKEEGKIFWYLVVATIPAGLVGILFEEKIEEIIRTNYILIALALMIVGVIIYVVDKNFKENKSIGKLTIKEALIIGFSQTLALIPGFSRSGTTITMGRILKLDRESSAKFSFYLSAPIVLGAVMVSLLTSDTRTAILNHLSIFIIGILVAFMFGLICIEFLLKYLKKNDFKIFMWYRLLLGLIVIIYIITR